MHQGGERRQIQSSFRCVVVQIPQPNYGLWRPPFVNFAGNAASQVHALKRILKHTHFSYTLMGNKPTSVK